MKKVFLYAIAALSLFACVKPEELPVVDPEVNGDGAVAFSVYAPKAANTRGGGQTGDLNNGNIGTNGFGVFAYYTAGEKYAPTAKPNFMYNQQVTKGTDNKWSYEPVKYWPNEYGNAAKSDEIDYVTFFAYAPWTNIAPTTGEIVPQEDKVVEKEQKYNIISVNKNNATGDPIIKYVVDTDPATSVDLLWGVAAADAKGNYSTINETANPVEVGMPFVDLVKPGNPKEDKISFNLKHSLAKVKFTIDYVKDDFTPEGALPEGTTTVPDGKQINAKETRIFVRSFTISGWATKGALNLNNTTAGEPLWKDYDGVKDLDFNDVTFNDGRKEGKEGDVNGAQTNEENQGLNPKIVENFCATKMDGEKKVFGDAKTPGVTAVPQLLFGGDDTKNGGYFYVIPRNQKSNAAVDATIVYDVETIDPNLASTLSDGETNGISVENVITKQSILGQGIDFEAGKQYLIKIHIGMTSVKIEAVVTDWVVTNDENVDLPDNQPMTSWTIDGVPGYFLEDPTNGIKLTDWACIYDATTWNDSYLNGGLGAYYAANPSEDLYNPTTHTATYTFNDKVYTVQFFVGSEDATPVVKKFRASWFSDEVQKITDYDDPTIEYYLQMFYNVPNEKYKLYTEPSGGVNATAADLTEEKFCARWIKVTSADFPDFIHCWEGAVNAAGAKYPWCVVSLPFPFEGNLKFVYGDDEKSTVYDYYTNAYSYVSLPKLFEKDSWMVTVDSGLQGGFDPANLQVFLMPATSAVHKHEIIY